MKSRTWLAWIVLVPAAFFGAKWLQAQEGPEIGLPPAGEVIPVEPRRIERFESPRPFRPTVPVDDLNSVPSRREEPVDAGILELPSDPVEQPPRRLPPPRTTNRFRQESPHTEFERSAIRRTSGLVPEVRDTPAPPSMDGHESHSFDQNLTVEWNTPDQATLGRPFACELVVRNNGSQAAQLVTVRDSFPPGIRVISSDPPAEESSGEYLWELGTIESRDERHIKFEMVADQRGEMTHEAHVTAQTIAPVYLQVTQPQLAVKASVPEKVLIGDPVTVTLEVSNPGDGQADEVVVRALLSDGLRHEKGSEFNVEVGSIAAGETRPIQLVCQTVAGGNQSAHISASGSGGLEADGDCNTMVTQASVDFVLEGPGLRYLDRQAIYTMKVTNTGDAPAEGVKVVATIPAGFKYIGHSTGGRADFSASSVTWTMGALAPGETKEVSYKCAAVEAGEQKHVAQVTGDRGLQKDCECVTRVEGISALLLEVVDVDDPVEVGAETSYEIRVTNQGSREATNVEIHALVPAEMSIREAQGPARYRVEGHEILFAPLAKLAPRADAIYRIFVTGAGKGDVRFRARLISDSLSEPVIEEESTKVYDD